MMKDEEKRDFSSVEEELLALVVKPAETETEEVEKMGEKEAEKDPAVQLIKPTLQTIHPIWKYVAISMTTIVLICLSLHLFYYFFYVKGSKK